MGSRASLAVRRQGSPFTGIGPVFMKELADHLSSVRMLVLTLYYQHELSLKEIALVLEVSDARVCQLSKQALAKACRFLTDRA